MTFKVFPIDPQLTDKRQEKSKKTSKKTHELCLEMQNDPTIQALTKLGHKPTQEAFLTMAYPDEEVTGELLANLPDFFHDLPKN